MAEADSYADGSNGAGLGAGFNAGSEGKGIIDLAAFLRAHGRGEESRCQTAVVPTGVPFNYRRLDEARYSFIPTCAQCTTCQQSIQS